MNDMAPWQRAASGAGLLGADGAMAATIFAEMSALAARDGVDQPRPGLPRRGRSRCSARGRARGDRGGRQPVPARPRHAGAARGDRRAPAAVLRHRLDPDREVLVTAGATEALAAAILALVEHRRRGRHLRAVLRRVRRAHRARHAASTAPSRCAAPTSSPTSTTSRAAVTRPHARHPAQHPAQPHRRRLRRRGARADRRAGRAARRHHRHRRGLRAPDVRRRAHPHRHPAWSARPHRHHLVAAARPSAPRDGRSAGSRRRPAPGSRARGQAVPHLRERCAVPARHRRGAAASPILSSRMPRARCAPSATCSRRDSPRRGSRSGFRRRVTSSSRMPPRRATRMPTGCVASCPAWRTWSPCP